MKSKSSKVILIAGITALAGVVIILAVLIFYGFDFTRFSTGEEPVKHTETLELSGCTELSVSLSVEDITIGVSNDDKVHVTYFDTEHRKHTLTQENGTISLVSENTGRSWLRLFEFTFNTDAYRDKILLPKDFCGNIIAKTDTGDIEAEGFAELERLNLRATTGDIECVSMTAREGSFSCTTGDIRVQQLTFDDSVDLTSTTGTIKLESVTAKDGITATNTTGGIIIRSTDSSTLNAKATTGSVKCTNAACDDMVLTATTGDVEISQIDAQSCVISTSTGDICGSVCGSRELYSIECSTHTGDCNLGNIVRENGRTLNVSASTGDIDISFAQ